MHSLSTVSTLGLAAAASLTFATSASAAFINTNIVNPGFETTGSGIPGWSLAANNNSEPTDGTGAAVSSTPPEGSRQALFFGNNANINGNGGEMSQVVTVDSGFLHTLTFQARSIIASGGGATELTVTAIDDGGAGSVLDQEVIALTETYTVYELEFTPTDTSVLFRFQETQDNSAGRDIGVDDLNLTYVPEPASLALLAAGGLCLLKRERKSASGGLPRRRR
jgi:hypothetical protein